MVYGINSAICNELKRDFLPNWYCIQKLADRNERLTKRYHPLRQKIIAAIGTTPNAPKKDSFWTYNELLDVVDKKDV